MPLTCRRQRIEIRQAETFCKRLLSSSKKKAQELTDESVEAQSNSVGPDFQVDSEESDSAIGKRAWCVEEVA
jgi:hypothetical protein